MMLFACSDETETANLSSNNTSTPTVLSPELNTLFIDSCALCHTNEKTGAPLAGDVETWNHILSKGMDETLDRAIQGFGGMPPNGQCFECTPEQLSQLIQYMSTSSPSGVES
ncbi:MAG: c-type cytochrome [Oleiphilus sp.]